MIGKSKKPKTGLVSEEYISSLLQKYTATTVLTLLQEMAQNPDVKYDWNELVKKTATGITNAREYQMLWRHLAYQHSLDDKFNDSAEPLDDDSDLEYEVEACPVVSSEAAAEAAACVKVLIASGSSSDANGNNGSTVEAPLTINIPNSQARSSGNLDPASMQGTNITVPVSVQKCESLPSVMSSEKLDTNASGSANRRKRKPWSAAEDDQLIAAVQKVGEGNWAIIVKGDFTGERTASQLSQRWAIIRKRRGTPVSVGNGSQLSEAQLAARRAMSLALNMPMGDNLRSAPSANNGTNTHVSSGNNIHSCAAETPSSAAQSLARSTSAAAQRARPSGSSKSRVATKKPVTKATLSPDSMVKAAAVAAGARIATPSDAASLLKAAQSKNAVHIMPGGSLIKSSGTGNTSQLPSNVHFIRTGLASKPLPTYPAAHPNASRLGKTVQAQGKPATPIVQTNSEDVVIGLGGGSSQVPSNSSSEQEIVNSSLDNATKGLGRKDNSGALCIAPSMEVNSKQVADSSSAMEKVRADLAALPGYSLKKKDTKCVQEDRSQVALPGLEDLGHVSSGTSAINGENGGKMLLTVPVKDPTNDTEPMDTDQTVNGGQEGDLQDMDVDENNFEKDVSKLGECENGAK